MLNTLLKTFVITLLLYSYKMQQMTEKKRDRKGRTRESDECLFSMLEDSSSTPRNAPIDNSNNTRKCKSPKVSTI